MKKVVFVSVLTIMILSACGTGKPALQNLTTGKPDAGNTAATNFHEPATWLLGFIKEFQFREMPHAEWYIKGFDAYIPDPSVIEKLKSVPSGDISIKIVLGTWCPDSRREVPRFMKVLNLWGFEGEKVEFTGVDISKNAPIAGFAELGIERVPTFIIMINKVEQGRIIENPVTSLEQDILDILIRNEKQ